MEELFLCAREWNVVFGCSFNFLSFLAISAVYSLKKMRRLAFFHVLCAPILRFRDVVSTVYIVCITCLKLKINSAGLAHKKRWIWEQNTPTKNRRQQLENVMHEDDITFVLFSGHSPTWSCWAIHIGSPIRLLSYASLFNHNLNLGTGIPFYCGSSLKPWPKSDESCIVVCSSVVKGKLWTRHLHPNNLCKSCEPWVEPVNTMQYVEKNHFLRVEYEQQSQHRHKKITTWWNIFYP